MKAQGEKYTLRDLVGRILLALFMVAMLGTMGAAVTQVRAAGGTCHNDSCNSGSNGFCQDLGCDYCDRNPFDPMDWECKESIIE